MKHSRIAWLSGAAVASVTLVALTVPVTGQQGAAGTAKPAARTFETSDRCQACHNGLVTPKGADASIGIAWRASMMANAARDPYWQAGVRREITQHPGAAAAIEHECSACHMPMMRYEAKAAGQLGGVFTHLPIGAGATRASTRWPPTACRARRATRSAPTNSVSARASTPRSSSRPCPGRIAAWRTGRTT